MIPLLDYPSPQHLTRVTRRRLRCCSDSCCRRRIVSDVGTTGSFRLASPLNHNQAVFSVIQLYFVTTQHLRLVDFGRNVASVGKGLHPWHKTLHALTRVSPHETFSGCPCRCDKLKLRQEHSIIPHKK